VRGPEIRILIVEHNLFLRDGLCLLIQGQPDFELVGTARSSEEAVELFVQHRPDVTLLDLDLPDSTGVTALRRILKKDPAACVVGLVTYEEDAVRQRVLQVGARSCVTKDRLNQDLVGLIRDCVRPPD
jgi:DNA-binding NarL/FixJ family response regulator